MQSLIETTEIPAPPRPPIPANETARIDALLALGILDTPAEQEYDDLLRLAATICGTPMGLVSLVDSERQWFKAKLGIPIGECSRDIALCAYVVAQDDLFVVNDARDDDRFRHNPFVTNDPNVRFYAGVPLTTDAGVHVGSLCVLDRVPRTLTPEQEHALHVLSRQVVMHFQLRQQVEESRRAQAALAASEAKFRRTLEHLADGVCIVDAARGRFIDANSALLSMLGYTLAEFTALDPFDIVAGETREEFHDNVRKMWEEIAARGISDVGCRLYRRKDGTVIKVYIRVTFVPDGASGMHAVVIRDITDEDRIQTALRESEQRFRAFMDSSPMAAFMKDREGRYTYVNQPLVQRFGFPEHAWIGRSDADLFPTTFSADWRENDLSVLDRNRVMEFSEVVPNGDGTFSHWNSFKFPFRDADGVTHLAGVAFDVTEKVSMELSLRENEEKFRRVVDGLPEGVLLVDISTMKIVQANGNFLRSAAATSDQVVGKSFYDFVQIDRGAMDDEIAYIAEHEQTRLGRHQLIRVDGTQLDVEIGLSYVSTTQTRMMSIVLRDMTEQRAYEDQLFEYQSGLEDANNKLRMLSVTDALTGAKNRAAFNDRLAEEFDRAVRHKHALSVVMFDVDHFKGYNDTFGHPAGDEVLRTVAETLQQTARVGDFVARYGGEEFAMILPDTDYSGSMVLAERCRRAIAARVFPHRSITASVGVSTMAGDSTASVLVKRADVALYKAKATGRNRVVHAQVVECEKAA
ncbi:MAG: sensor domain-containing diguanylate cyclase [Gemmatimonas sp.]